MSSKMCTQVYKTKQIYVTHIYGFQNYSIKVHYLYSFPTKVFYIFEACILWLNIHLFLRLHRDRSWRLSCASVYANAFSDFVKICFIITHFCAQAKRPISIAAITELQDWKNKSPLSRYYPGDILHWYLGYFDPAKVGNCDLVLTVCCV